MRAAIISATLFGAAGCINTPVDSDADILRVTVSGNCVDRAACFVGKTMPICPVIEPMSEGSEKCLKFKRYAYDAAAREVVTDERVPEGFEGVVQFPAWLMFEDGAKVEVELTMYTGIGMCGMPAVVAFRGYDDDGHVVIETDHGVAALLSPWIVMEISDARVLIDAESREIITKLTAPHDAESAYGFLFVDRDTFYFFNREVCMTAAGVGRGLMEPVTAGCAPLTITGSWENDRGLTPAEPGDVEIAAQALPNEAEWFGDAFHQRVSRIADTDVIVVDPVVPCT